MQEAELAQLYQQYGYLVHRRCMALLRDRNDAEDAVQEVFMRVHRYGRNQKGPSVLSWLYVIALNCCCDLMRRRSRETVAKEDTLEQVDGQSVGDASDADRRALLGAALRRMDHKTCEIGILHHLDGLTQEEVAVNTGYSRRTIGKKLRAFDEHLKTLWISGGGSQ